VGENYKYLYALSISVIFTLSAALSNDAAAQTLAKGSGSGPRSSLLSEVAENHSVVSSANTPEMTANRLHDLVSISSVPADHRLRIVISDPAFFGSAANITDLNGQLMQELSLKHVTNVDVANWPAGSYTLRLVDGRSFRIDHR
jgi:hypothetical protein